MVEMDEIIRKLKGNAEAIRSMAQSLTEEQAQWKPGPEIWSMQEVMAHVYNEERVDFRKHLRDMFHQPPIEWMSAEREPWLQVATCREALEKFIIERESSIAWLSELTAPDWDLRQKVEWGEINAGDVLVSWVDHDYLHMRQMVEVLHAFTVKQSDPYSVRYAGGW